MTVGRLRWCLLTVLAVCLAAAPSTWAHPAVASRSAPAAVPELGHRGAFLTDQAGRVVFLHGVNVVYKLPPYVAPDTAAGFTARDADFLAAHGFDAVRLGVLFAGVMPRPGQIDQNYLAQVDRIVQLLTARKIWVLLDFHQDAFNEKFHGEGFPAWAVHDDGLPFIDLGSFFANDQTPAVQRAYDHVWNDDYQLWDYYTQAWVAVAKKWVAQPYLMGFDLFNEPNAGSQSATCANPAGCPQFDAVLQRFYDHVRTAIRTVDPHHLVWYEPQFLFNALSASNFTHVDDPNVGLSWHDYACTPAFVSGGVLPGDPDCQINEPRVMDNAAAQEAAMGAGGLLTEFGAEDDSADIARLTQFADQHLTGWMYWAYKEWNDPTGSSDEGLYGNDAQPSTVKAAKVSLLAYPYPQAVAGTPLAVSWDRSDRVLSFSYRPDPATGLTDVFVGDGTYPQGYTVSVSGGSVRAGSSASHVLISATEQSKTVTVVVHPR
jgi:endoglycosylceramidase